jgi:dolichol-phosphate mannosyltransferase
MKSVSVVICAYNEENNVRPVVEEAVRVLEGLKTDYEVIVVDDGSRDATLSVVQEYARAHDRIKIIVHPKNGGIGASLLDGYRMAQKDLVTWLPADGQISPNDIKLFYDNIGDHDMAVSYYVERPFSLLRLMTNKGMRLLIFVLFGGMARYEGTYMFRREILPQLPLKMHTSFVLNYEFVLRAGKQGYKIKEVPTRCLERASGSSKVLGLKKILFVFNEIIKLRVKHF